MICKVVQGSPCTIIFSFMENTYENKNTFSWLWLAFANFFQSGAQFKGTGVLMHSKTRAEEIQKEKGVYATDDFEEVIALRPDFAILCVPRPVMKDFIVRFMKAQIPVLCETPPGKDVTELNEIWQEKLRYNGKVQVAEQYFMQPVFVSGD